MAESGEYDFDAALAAVPEFSESAASPDEPEPEEYETFGSAGAPSSAGASAPAGAPTSADVPTPSGAPVGAPASPPAGAPAGTPADQAAPRQAGPALAAIEGPWNAVLPSLAGAPESAFDLDRAARVLARLAPVDRWDAVVVSAQVPVGGKPSSIVPGTASGVPGCMYLFLNEAAVQAVFGANPRAGAASVNVELKTGRLVSLLREGVEAGENCGGFLIYGMADGPARAGVPAFLPVKALAPIDQTLEAILVLARARNGQLPEGAVVQALGARTFFYSGAWLAEGEALAAVELDGAPSVPLFLSPKTLLKAAAKGVGGVSVGAGANLATITLNDALGRVPAGARIVIEPGAGYSVPLAL